MRRAQHCQLISQRFDVLLHTIIVTYDFRLLVAHLRLKVGHAAHQLSSAPHRSLDWLQTADGRSAVGAARRRRARRLHGVTAGGIGKGSTDVIGTGLRRRGVKFCRPCELNQTPHASDDKSVINTSGSLSQSAQRQPNNDDEKAKADVFQIMELG